MAALTDNASYASSLRGSYGYAGSNNEEFFTDQLVGMDDSTGLVKAWEDEAGLDFVGLCQRQATGDTTVTDEDAVVHVDESGRILKRVDVTGVSAQSNVGDDVYCATDNIADLKVAANTNNSAIGRIVKRHGGTTCDVRLKTPEEYKNQ